MKGKYLLFLVCASSFLFNSASAVAQESHAKLKAYSTVKSARDSMGNQISPQDSVSSLATFTYTVTSSRDPFGNNPTPAWGHTGQASGCQNNLEVGDPLSGTDIPPVKGANGFTYHLQELAFFSWFYGAPSIAANDWFSDNNTFTTDAGPVCK